ncbi:MAG: hypothetical protein M1828_001378 [Chrysothrix sp. TS-e1954]|nr:MAG: hypothetical protein M1828_001378 [Chrysothrix sp. TS-e1954]
MDSSEVPNSNRFPHFSDGDVLVVLSPSNTYHLHARTLRLHSTTFEHMLSDENAARLNNRARRDGVTVRWRVDLKLPDGEAGEANGWGALFPRRLDERGRASSSNVNPDMDNGLLRNPIYKHYDNILRAFYSEPLQFDRKRVHVAMLDCMAVINIAEGLDCVSLISMPVDSALIRFGQELWHAIAQAPVRWANIALGLKSELLYREAVIHLVGRYPGRDSDDPNVAGLDWPQLKPATLELVKHKDKALDLVKRSVETRIMGYYPPKMQSPHVGNANVGPGSVTKRGMGMATRVSVYQKDIFGWMAACLFRHWLGQGLCNDQSRRAADGGWTFYDAIERGSDAYIARDAIENFTHYFPLSAKARSTFEVELGEMKDHIKSYVVALLEKKLHLDVNKTEVRYLTCADIERDDLPWIQARKKKQTRIQDRAAAASSARQGSSLHPHEQDTETSEPTPPRAATGSKRRRLPERPLKQPTGPFQQSDDSTDDVGMPADLRARPRKRSAKEQRGRPSFRPMVARDAREDASGRREAAMASMSAQLGGIRDADDDGESADEEGEEGDDQGGYSDDQVGSGPNFVTTGRPELQELGDDEGFSEDEVDERGEVAYDTADDGVD